MSRSKTDNLQAFEQRSCGFLLHMTSLLGPHGSGDLGGAGPIIEFAERAGFGWWQMLPVHPPDGFASPYQSASSFAGHPGLIDLSALVRCGWLTKRVLNQSKLPSGNHCDFGKSNAVRNRLLRLAFDKFDQAPPAKLKLFKRVQAHWICDWALFSALTEEAKGATWQSWSDELRDRLPPALRAARKRLAREIRYHVFVQYVFDQDWQALRKRAQLAKLRLLGDLPKFVAASSADAWTHPELFCLDARGRIATEAGTPPDAFTRFGQRWGVPTYRVAAHRKTKYAWWIARIKRELELFDALRLDHFIGYARTFSIPAAKRSEGRYVRGLGRGLFEALAAEFGELPFIVEDLGDAGPDVDQLRERFGFPGTKVLQFGLDGLQGDNPYLPHTWKANTVAYTGTHDNPTSVSWFKAHPTREGTKKRGVTRPAITTYTGGTGQAIHRDMLRLLWTSAANTVIAPMQDLLGLDASARMNVPGRAGGNWSWRLRDGQLSNELASQLRLLANMTGRCAN